MATNMTREEALNKVRQMSLPKETMEILEALVPELKESEDEKIRKELVAFFKGMQDSPWHEEYWHDLEIVRILAYLEKQKECVSNNFDDVWNEEDCEEIIAEGQKLTPKFKELLKEVCHAWYDRGVKLEKQKEDEGYEAIPVESTLEYKLGFKAGKESEKQKEQKPAEWSEEDEKMLQSIIKDFRAGKVSTIGQERWLKSLRPQPHWKPSEEQMKALSDACCISFEEERDFHPSLSRLYHDLMKL